MAVSANSPRPSWQSRATRYRARAPWVQQSRATRCPVCGPLPVRPRRPAGLAPFPFRGARLASRHVRLPPRAPTIWFRSVWMLPRSAGGRPWTAGSGREAGSPPGTPVSGLPQTLPTEPGSRPPGRRLMVASVATVSVYGLRAGQDKTRQEKAGQDKTGQGKARRGKARPDKTRQDKTRQDKTRQDKTRQDKTRHTRHMVPSLQASCSYEKSYCGGMVAEPPA